MPSWVNNHALFLKHNYHLLKHELFFNLLGYLSSPGSTSCEQCQAGYECPNTADPSANKQCYAGSYSIAGQMTCTTCPAGKICPSTMYVYISLNLLYIFALKLIKSNLNGHGKFMYLKLE